MLSYVLVVEAMGTGSAIVCVWIVGIERLVVSSLVVA